ncbi:hypotheticall protein [Colletotrichum tropicale]|nr:hypotheticall protein [Colletotrichum tropicale]
MPSCQPPDAFADGGTVVTACAHSADARDFHRKRIVICCDGTWNDSNAEGGIQTNVGRLATVVAHKCCNGMPQVVYYHRGAGTEQSLTARALGGIFGQGVVADIADVYRFVCENYNDGDELIFTGFSRGAFTARSVANMVCTLGLLNSFGLDSFPTIFKDYQNFSSWISSGTKNEKTGEWKFSTKFDRKKHLLCFNLESSHRLYRMDEQSSEDPDWMKDRKTSEHDIDALRQRWFKDLLLEGARNGLQAMADYYASLLFHACLSDSFSSQYKMIVCEKKSYRNDSTLEEILRSSSDPWVPGEIEVKAVGVWDTVGSLGMPYSLSKMGRSEDEIRFGSQDVHERIQHAFHALALDEYRKPFKPTLWSRDVSNKNTHLRQVWFPGSHSDVGGGLANQQMATIAFAWMADQLSSVGVEFNPEEMTRIFRTVDLEVAPRSWALGQISSAEFWTKLADNTIGKLAHFGEAAHREPGLCTKDNNPLKSRLKNTNELIHPSVRMRYLYRGLGLDDNGEWKCEALSSSHYILEKSEGSRDDWVRRPDQSYLSTHRTLSGNVSSIHGGTKITFLEDVRPHSVVAKQLPFESDLQMSDVEISTWRSDMPYCGLPNDQGWQSREVGEEQVRRDGELMNDGNVRNSRKDSSISQHDQPRPVENAADRWAWVRSPPKSKGAPSDVRIVLHEERIGLWERQYMRINQENMLREDQWKRKRNPDRGPLGTLATTVSGLFTRAVQAGKKTVETGYQAAATVVTLPPKLYTTSVGRLSLAVSSTTNMMIWGTVKPKEDVMKMLKGPPTNVDPDKYVWEDVVAWQHGDLRVRR